MDHYRSENAADQDVGVSAITSKKTISVFSNIHERNKQHTSYIENAADQDVVGGEY